VSAWLDGAALIRAALEAAVTLSTRATVSCRRTPALRSAVTEAGLTFVGPACDAIALMGDKISARHFAVTHGVPVTPSADEADDPATFAERARAVGFPLLIKGAAGGGGKGMQIVREPAALDAISGQRAQREPALLW
jgi:acetyl-CoA/propionyl-CoA carboxylase biotin carboxyl carrier protein